MSFDSAMNTLACNKGDVSYLQNNYETLVKPFEYHNSEIKVGYINIWYGDTDGVIIHGPTYFDNVYDDAWLKDPLVREMIMDVDKNYFEGDRIISPILGEITPERLSGGVKCLILMWMLNVVINATSCGENCAEWINIIAKKKPLEIQLKYLMSFRNVSDMQIHVMNTGTVYDNWEVLLKDIIQQDLL